MTKEEAINKAEGNAQRLRVDYVVIAVPNELTGGVRHAAIRATSWDALAPWFGECRKVADVPYVPARVFA